MGATKAIVTCSCTKKRITVLKIIVIDFYFLLQSEAVVIKNYHYAKKKKKNRYFEGVLSNLKFYCTLKTKIAIATANVQETLNDSMRSYKLSSYRIGK